MNLFFVFSGLLGTRVLTHRQVPPAARGGADRAFLDPEGSTRIAETLGDREFLRFLSQVFLDMADPVIEADGEIYRYVGDEIIITWLPYRMLPWLWETPPIDRRFYPVYAACRDLGVPFCTPIGHIGPLMPSEAGRPVYLDQVALDFPELVIVAGHIGYPGIDEAVAVATKHEHVYIDTSAYKVRRYPSAIVDYMRGHGRTKVLFASNYPMILPAEALVGLEGLALDQEARALFLGENARRVFKLA